MNIVAPRSTVPVAGFKSPTEMVELPGSECPGLSSCQKQRGGNALEPMTVSVILKQESTHTLGQLSAFAKANHLAVESIDPRTNTVKLQGTALSCQKAFGVQLNTYKPKDGAAFRAYEGAVKLPRALAGNVQAVLGLSDRPVARPLHHILNKADFGGGYSAPEVGAMYNFPKNMDGTGQTIGILEFGGGYNQADLDAYFKKLGMPTPQVSAVSIDGQQNTPGTDQNTDAEVALDIEVAGSIAPKARVVVYFAPDTEQGFADAINAAAHDTTNNPKILSLSWGSDEDSTNDPPPTGWSKAGIQAVDAAIKNAAQSGVNLFSAAGDSGSNSENGGKTDVMYPAASPWAIGVGGTELQENSDGSRGSETAWDGSGGGVSNLFAKPDFQANAGVPAPAQPGGGRGIPDVSANASPSTGYDVIWDGQEQPIGGTSAAAPLYAGLAALLAQGAGHPLPYLNPFFYQHPEAFNDITSGSNGAFNAGPGWDPVTGLGSPDGTKLLAALQAQKA
ncbi:MAG: S53 family peptidase [Candidatus Xenobia bacterium]